MSKNVILLLLILLPFVISISTIPSSSTTKATLSSSSSHFKWDESGITVGEDVFLEEKATDDPVKDLVDVCPEAKKIKKINAKRGKSKYFQVLDKGMSRFQTLCAQFDVDLFELGAAVASSGASTAAGGKALPFSTVISFGLNLQITYGTCKAEGGCALAVSAEASIGVTLGIKLGNFAGTQASAFMSGGFEISSENALTCDPDIHGVPFLTPLSFKCGAGRLIGLWFMQFFDSQLSHDPTFQATAYRALISDVEQLEVEDGAMAEQEAVSNLIVELQAGRKEFNKNPVSLTRNPLYLKGSIFNYMYEMFMSPVFWAEAQLAQVELQRIHEQNTHPNKALDGPFPQHSMHNKEAPHKVAVYPDIVNDAEKQPLKYTGEPVIRYLLSSDRLKQVYEAGSDNTVTTVAFNFFRSNDPACTSDVFKSSDNDDDTCTVTHPGMMQPDSKIPWKPKPNQRVQWNSLFSTSDNILELRRRFVWYVRWLLEVQVLQAFFWPSLHSGMDHIRRNFPRDLDRCTDLPVSFEDVVKVSDFPKDSASIKLAQEWGLCSGGGETLPRASNPEFKNVCKKDFRYHWNPRYWCHVGKSLSAIPNDHSECHKTSIGCIYLDRPRFERTKGTERPRDRYLYTQDRDTIWWDKDTDSYTKSRHDDFFPDEYEIPLWSANVFPGVTKEIMNTMEELRSIDNIAEGIELIHTFRSKLTPSPHHHGHVVGEDTEVSEHGSLEASPIPLSRKSTSLDLFSDIETGRGCNDDPLCITNFFTSFFRVAPRSRMEQVVYGGKLVSFKDKIMTINAGLAYQMQTGYVNKVKSQLAAARKKLDSMTKTLILKHRIDYSMGFTFGFTFGKSGLGFCTPDVNTVQMNMPLLQWNGFIEPGKLRRSIIGTKPDEWGAEFFLFFPKIPVNIHIKRTGQFGSPGYTFSISVKVRIKNEHPVGSFAVGETVASHTSSGIPHFVAAALPTICETLLPALIRIVMYGGSVLKNPKVSGPKALGLLRRALGNLLSPFGGLIAMGTSWFAPPSLFTSDTRHALVLTMVLKPKQTPTFKATYAYTTVKEFTLPLGTALTVKPASVFGARFDIASWINANILVNIPSIFGKKNANIQHFPPDAFRTSRCNKCIEVFGLATRGYARDYCSDKSELCHQIQTSVRMFLDSNGSPGFWRTWFGGGANYATKTSYQRLYGKKGTHKRVREKFEMSCEIWPTKKERKKCLIEEFCRYSGIGCIVVPETNIETVESDLRTAIENDGGIRETTDIDGGGNHDKTNKAEERIRPMTTSLYTDMQDDAESYMGVGLLRRKHGGTNTAAEKTGDFRRRSKEETKKLNGHMIAVRNAARSNVVDTTKEEEEEENIWGGGAGDHAGGTRTVRRGREVF